MSVEKLLEDMRRERIAGVMQTAVSAGKVIGMRDGAAIIEALARDGTASPAKLRAVASQMRDAANTIAAKLPPEIGGLGQ